MNRLHRYLNRLVDDVTPRKILWFIIIAFCLYFTFVAFARHNNYYSQRLDLGNMEQTIWNVVHGNGFTLTDPMGTAQESRLAVHADFLMILLTPLYMVWSSPNMLLLIQTIVVCLGALPIYWIARDKLRSQKLALLFSVGYLLYPPLERVMLHDFHAVALSTTFLLFAYWYMIKGRYGLFLLYAILAGLGKEQVWVATGLMGLSIAVRNKRIILGVVIAGMSFFFFYYLFWRAIPAVTIAKQHFALTYLSDFGESQNVIIKHLLGSPWSVIQTALLPDRLYYYFQLLIPLALLPIIAPWPLLFSAHSILINVLSNNGLMRQIDYQYTSDITPFLFIAAIEGYAVLSKRRYRFLPSLVLGGFILMSILWGELPFGMQSRFFYFTSAQPEKAAMQQVETMIPSMYTVSATNNIGAHFAGRQYLYNFPVNALTADYSIAMLGDQYAWPSGDAQKAAVNELLASPDYMLIAHQNDFYAFKKRRL